MSIGKCSTQPEGRQNMNATKGKFLFAAIATAVAASASITRADDQPVVYGRAGIPVAEQRIQQLSHFRPMTARATDRRGLVWSRGLPGRRGQRATAVPAPKAYAAGQTRAPVVYGRAGVPLPFASESTPQRS